MSTNNFVGYLVSIETRNVFFQGIINSIDTKNSLIQIKNCFQNGINLGPKLVDVKTNDIENIEILADPIKAASLLKPINDIEQSQEHKIINQNSNQNYNRNKSKIILPNNHYQRNSQNGNQQSQDCFNSQNEDSIEEDFDFEKNLALFDKDAFFEKMEGHPRQTKNLTFNENSSSIQKKSNDESTFVRYHQISVDNLFSSVSKQSRHSENRNSFSNVNVNGQPSSKGTGARNYRFDEMILDTGEPINFRQIKLPDQFSNSKNYVTDEGFLVPCIDLRLKEALISQSYKHGFSKPRQIECMGRCCAEMCLQLLGGSIRFLPKNNHQKPSILVLANNYSIQGVYALCTSRLLSIRSVKIYLLVMKSNEEDSAEFKNELNFFVSNFDSATCSVLKSVNELNSIKSIDLILSGLDSFKEESCLLKNKNQTNVQYLKKFVQSCKANVLSIDPSVNENVVNSKWCITSILPMQMPKNSGRVYLCDMGFTKQIFDSVNIKYQSPFGAKFVIPLHDD